MTIDENGFAWLTPQPSAEPGDLDQAVQHIIRLSKELGVLDEIMDLSPELLNRAGPVSESGVIAGQGQAEKFALLEIFANAI